MNIIDFIYLVMTHPFFIGSAILLSFVVKLYLLYDIKNQCTTSMTTRRSCILLVAILVGSLFGDIAWLVKLFRELQLIPFSYALLVFCVRISWAFLIIQYQSLAFFLESITKPDRYLNTWYHKVTLLLSSIFFFYFLYLAFFEMTLTDALTRGAALAQPYDPHVPFEIKMMRSVAIYLLIIVAFPGIIMSSYTLLVKPLPRIIKKQVRTFIFYLICPYIFSEALQAATLSMPFAACYLYPIVGFSTLLISYALHFGIKTAFSFRFLNKNKYVQCHEQFTVLYDVKELLDQLSNAQSMQELGHITQTYFKQLLTIPVSNIHFHSFDEKSTHNDAKPHQLDVFLANNQTHKLLFQEKILIYDEILFNQFYEPQEQHDQLLTILNELNADIMVPIIYQQRCIAAVVIKKTSPSHICTSTQRDGMLIFANYVSSIIPLLPATTIDALESQEKKLREKFYMAQQEIHHLQESLSTLLQSSRARQVGLVFYKNNRFIYGNHIASAILGLSELALNKDTQCTAAFYQCIAQLEKNGTQQSICIKNNQGDDIILCPLTLDDDQGIIISVYQADMIDVMYNNIDAHSYYSHWDYLLYLQTTKIGKQINALIPGFGQSLLATKIAFLKAALSNQPTLIEAHPDDSLAIAQLLHNASCRERFHVMQLHMPDYGYAHDELFGTPHIADHTLLHKLNGIGTLFISNVHHLKLETQQQLWHLIKSDIQTNVRLVVATHKNIQHGIDSEISYELLYSLKSTALIVPSLHSLACDEFDSLIDGYCTLLQPTVDPNQTILTAIDKQALKQQQPRSLCELKQNIEQYLQKKRSLPTHDQPSSFNLNDIAQKGRNALKNEEIMRELWHLFKNQNKIATLLGVSRSSVNRRCKQYALHE